MEGTIDTYLIYALVVVSLIVVALTLSFPRQTAAFVDFAIRSKLWLLALSLIALFLFCVWPESDPNDRYRTADDSKSSSSKVTHSPGQ